MVLFYWRNVTGESGPVALETSLGWVLSGAVPDAPSTESTQVNITTLCVDTEKCPNLSDRAPEWRELEEKLTQFWDLESIGIKSEELSVYDKFKRDISFNNERYEVTLPWKHNHPTLPDNLNLCQARLTGLVRQLKSEGLMKEYDTVIRDQLERGIIQEIDPAEKTEGVRLQYLPHHPVVRQDKDTTKLRIVYDASAKTREGPSLNSCLYTGPCLLSSIVDTLIRFRYQQNSSTCRCRKGFFDDISFSL